MHRPVTAHLISRASTASTTISDQHFGSTRLAREGEPQPRSPAVKDIMGMMKKVQEVQSRMTALQEELETVEVQGAAGGGMVSVTMTAKGAVKSIAIDDSLIVKEEKDILEDLIMAAVNDARAKAERATQEKMSAITAGLPIPPGMKLF
jgi:DNA-binding YbaB/EbfC family protein